MTAPGWNPDQMGAIMRDTAIAVAIAVAKYRTQLIEAGVPADEARELTMEYNRIVIETLMSASKG